MIYIHFEDKCCDINVSCWKEMLWVLLSIVGPELFNPDPESSSEKFQLRFRIQIRFRLRTIFWKMFNKKINNKLSFFKEKNSKISSLVQYKRKKLLWRKLIYNIVLNLWELLSFHFFGSRSAKAKSSGSGSTILFLLGFFLFFLCFFIIFIRNRLSQFFFFYRLVNTKCMGLVEQWKKMTHSNLVSLRQVQDMDIVESTLLWIRIRINLSRWRRIRIEEGKNDPQKLKKIKNFHVLKC